MQNFFNIFNKLHNKLIALGFFTILFLPSCTWNTADRDPYANSTALQIHEEATTHLKKGRYELSSKSYEALETHYPFGDITTKAQLEIIYAYYKDQEYLQSITAAERFLRLHPLNQNADYAHYMKGIAYFEQNKNFINKIFTINPALRDINSYQLAFNNFKTIVQSYPNSPYAKDSRAYMVYIRNLIAEHELAVAKYYVDREAYLAAANRARYVLEHLPNTPAEAPALELLDKMYSKLQLTPVLKSKSSA